jgi:hypothetical protein
MQKLSNTAAVTAAEKLTEKMDFFLPIILKKFKDFYWILNF